MNQAQMQEALSMMVKAIEMMEAAMGPSAQAEDTVQSTGQLSNI